MASLLSRVRIHSPRISPERSQFPHLETLPGADEHLDSSEIRAIGVIAAWESVDGPQRAVARAPWQARPAERVWGQGDEEGARNVGRLAPTPEPLGRALDVARDLSVYPQQLA